MTNIDVEKMNEKIKKRLKFFFDIYENLK